MLDELETRFFPEMSTRRMPFQRDWMLSPLHVAAAAIVRLWEERDYPGTPLIFQTIRGDTKLYHPELLDKTILRLSKLKATRGKLIQWELLSAPPYAGEIGAIPVHEGVFEPNLQGRAGIYDKNTVPGPLLEGWFAYHFQEWSALSVRIAAEDEDEAQGFTIIPRGRQDDWLAFQSEVNTTTSKILRRERRSRIEIIGSPSDERFPIEEEIRKTTLDHVILPQELIKRVTSQRSIFQPEMLKRYETLHVPRLRKVLLIGPPGTGKTTLAKALAADHQKQGGYVAYVFADEQGRSWTHLHHALGSAVRSKLPTLVVVEDLENFVSKEEHMQAVLNVLDGVTTPDNPAGTLLLATTNAPERIDRRITQRPGRIDVMIEIGAIPTEDLAIRFLRHFLDSSYNAQEHNPMARKLIGQVGSHVREICLLSAIRAVEQSQDHITYTDLLWAHQALLDGRKAAANLDTCEPPAAKGTGPVGFGR